MQSKEAKNAAQQIETLEGVSYDVQPANRYRKMKVGGRARLFVSETLTYVPQTEFFFVQNHIRFRLKIDGPLERTLVYCKLVPNRDATRQRERYFRPVRILGMNPIPRPDAGKGIDGPRPITDDELELVSALLPADHPNRREVLSRARNVRVRAFKSSILYLSWPGAALGATAHREFSRGYVCNTGEPATVSLAVNHGVPITLVSRKRKGGFGVLPSPRELCFA